MTSRIYKKIYEHTQQNLADRISRRWCLPMSALCVLVSCSLLSGRSSADTLDTINRLSQDDFATFTENLGAATHYKSIAPPENLGPLGFDVGLEVSSTAVRSSLFDRASDDNFPGNELIIPRLHVHKGLPFGVDLGASLGVVPDSDASVIGGEVRFAIVRGDTVTPAVAIRLTHSQVQGLDDFSLKNTALELGVSKGFLFITPYAGVGIVRTSGDPKNINTLSSETSEQTKFVIGATFNFGFALTLEVDRTGDYRTYSAKAGIRF